MCGMAPSRCHECLGPRQSYGVDHWGSRGLPACHNTAHFAPGQEVQRFTPTDLVACESWPELVTALGIALADEDHRYAALPLNHSMNHSMTHSLISLRVTVLSQVVLQRCSRISGAVSCAIQCSRTSPNRGGVQRTGQASLPVLHPRHAPPGANNATMVLKGTSFGSYTRMSPCGLRMLAVLRGVAARCFLPSV